MLTLTDFNLISVACIVGNQQEIPVGLILIANLPLDYVFAGCRHDRGVRLSNNSGYCFVESGWLDSSNGC